MTGEPGGSGFSRRHLLFGGAAAAGAGAAVALGASAAIRAGTGAADDSGGYGAGGAASPAAVGEAIVPFHGVHQAGVETPPQAHAPLHRARPPARGRRGGAPPDAAGAERRRRSRDAGARAPRRHGTRARRGASAPHRHVRLRAGARRPSRRRGAGLAAPAAAVRHRPPRPALERRRPAAADRRRRRGHGLARGAHAAEGRAQLRDGALDAARVPPGRGLGARRSHDAEPLRPARRHRQPETGHGGLRRARLVGRGAGRGWPAAPRWCCGASRWTSTGGTGSIGRGARHPSGEGSPRAPRSRGSASTTSPTSRRSAPWASR